MIYIVVLVSVGYSKVNKLYTLFFGVVFLKTAILAGVPRCFKVVLVCISPVTNGVEHLFMGHLYIFCDKRSIRVFAHFYMGCFS